MNDDRARTPHKTALSALKRIYMMMRHATAIWRAFPDFIIIGVQKGGTSSLFEYLGKHPQICSSSSKEVHYFDNNYHRGSGWYRAYFPLTVLKKLWAAIRGGPILCGEASPYYIYHPLAAERIRADLPKAKLIVLLRDPVERAYSHYKMERRKGKEELSFEEAIRAEPQRLNGESAKIAEEQDYYSFAHQTYSYCERGYYGEQLQRWYQLFPREQILVIFAEQFYADPDRVYQEVLRFLGLPSFSLEHYQIYNAAAPEDALQEELMTNLRSKFEQSNKELAVLLERELPWPA